MIEKITKTLGWSREETQVLTKEVVRIGRKYTYFIFFLLGVVLILASTFPNAKIYTVLIGIAIMIISLLSYPKIKIKKIKPEKEKIKPVKEKQEKKKKKTRIKIKKRNKK